MDFHNAKLHHATKAKAEALEAMLQAEYPALTIVPTTNEDASQVIGFQTLHRTSADADPVVVLETKKVPELADLFAACEDQDLDPEAIEAEEAPKASGSVVDECYRQQYKEQSSTGQSCGDWLAEWLTRALDAQGKLDCWCFGAILKANGVDLNAKWAQVAAQTTPGWQGRYRMNGRQVMEKHVAKAGTVFDESGNAHEVPEDELARLRTKHGKWLAKEQKREEAATKVAEALAAE